LLENVRNLQCHNKICRRNLQCYDVGLKTLKPYNAEGLSSLQYYTKLPIVISDISLVNFFYEQGSAGKQTFLLYRAYGLYVNGV
jgi:hypothetical protein